MLVLTIDTGKSFTIGKDITVTVLKIRSKNSARIGISAPKEIPIQRDDMIKTADNESVE